MNEGNYNYVIREPFYETQNNSNANTAPITGTWCCNPEEQGIWGKGSCWASSERWPKSKTVEGGYSTSNECFRRLFCECMDKRPQTQG